jgi:hypothetical protein
LGNTSPRLPFNLPPSFIVDLAFNCANYAAMLMLIVFAGISTIAAWLMLFRGIDWFDGFGFTRRNRGRGLAYIAIGFLLFCLSGWLCWLSRPY